MAIIERRQGKNGTQSFRVKIRIKGHRPKSATFEKLTDAREWARNEESDIKRGLKFDDYLAQTKTLSQAIDEYVKAPDLKLKAELLPARKQQLAWWRQELGAHFLADITPDKLNRCKRLLMTKPRGNVAGGRPITAATVNHYLISLSAVLGYARKELNWLRTNPVTDIAKLELKNSRVRYLSKVERESLLGACQKTEKRKRFLYPLVLLALSTGMRKGEILALRWRDVDLVKGTLRVEDSKNGEKRSLPLTGRALEALKALSSVRRIDTDLIFSRKDGKAPLEFKRQWEGAIKETKLKDFRFHDLRHTAATYLLESGATLPELSALLGHKTIQMVKRYAHLADNHARSVVKKMNRRVLG